jgi:hypothetical protein
MRIIILLLGCITSLFLKADPISSADKWNQYCYTSFYSDTAYLAGVGATDCGFISDHSTEGEKINLFNCAKNANSSKEPFKFGVSWSGIDSRVCEAVIRDSKHKYWLTYFDSYTHRSPKERKRPYVSIVSCKNFIFNETKKNQVIAFEEEACDDSPEMQKLLESLPI